MPLSKALWRVLLGLVLLMGSFQILVGGAVALVVQLFGVSQGGIGLTVVALGTSLPELASSLLAARKGEHDPALGHVLGAHLLNTLGVVGLAGIIRSFAVEPITLYGDMPVMLGFLFLIYFGFQGRLGRLFWGAMVCIYTPWLVVRAILG